MYSGGNLSLHTGQLLLQALKQKSRLPSACSRVWGVQVRTSALLSRRRKLQSRWREPCRCRPRRKRRRGIRSQSSTTGRCCVHQIWKKIQLLNKASARAMTECRLNSTCQREIVRAHVVEPSWTRYFTQSTDSIQLYFSQPTFIKRQICTIVAALAIMKPIASTPLFAQRQIHNRETTASTSALTSSHISVEVQKKATEEWTRSKSQEKAQNLLTTLYCCLSSVPHEADCELSHAL